jgi:hypothetical protein
MWQFCHISLAAGRSSTLGSSDTSHRRAYEHQNRTGRRYTGPIVRAVILVRPCILGSGRPLPAEFVARSPQDFRTQCRNHSEQDEARDSSGN